MNKTITLRLKNLAHAKSIITFLLLFVLLIPYSGNGQCSLDVDCSNIFDQQLACRADLPAVDFDLPIIVDSCGDVTLSALTIIPGSSACPDDTLFVTRTYFIQDATGNMEQCMQTFTIVDDIPPMMLCQPFTLELDASGMGTLTTADIDAGSTANCGSPVILTLSQSDFSCADVGDVDVWLFGEDACGNIDSCMAVVTVEDNIDPVITCPMDITMDSDPDRCTAVVCFDVDVTDNCEAILPDDIPGYIFLGSFGGHNYFTVSVANALVWEDANEAAASIGGHLAVITSEAEQDFLIDNLGLGRYWIGLRYSPSLDAFKWVNGEPFAYEAWGLGQPGLLEGDYVFNLDVIGTFADGWYDSQSFLPARYIVEIETYETDLTAGLPPGANFPVGITEVTYVATDASGNTDECSFNVTVVDVQTPEIDCPADMVFQLMEEQCDTLLTFVPDFTDNCPGAVITQIEGPLSGTAIPIGENIVSFEAVDTTGNADTCTFSITVLDFVPNGMACNGVINFSLDDGTCSGELLPGMVTDISSIGCADSCTISIIDPDGTRRPAIFFTDDIGESYDYEICCGGICCWGVVNVEFKFNPIIECVEFDTLSCTQSFDESLITPDVSMSCADVELIIVDETIDYLTCDSMFTASMTRKYTAIDEYGNTSDTCTQTIFLERTNLDSISPVQPFALHNNMALDCGSGFATTSQGFPFPALSVTGAPRLRLESGGFLDLFPFESSIICNGYAEFEDEILAGSTSCVTKIMRTFTIGEWWCSQTNQRQFFQLIEVVDFTGPKVTCPADLTLSTSGFSCEASSAFDLPEVSDLCNDDNIRIDLSAPTSTIGFVKDYNGGTIMLPVGVNELTYHVYDDCDNRTDCSFLVTVRDDADPIAICDQFTTVGIGLDDLTKVTAEAIDDGSFDECGPVELTVARMDSPGFDDLIGFGPDVDITCADVGSVVMVGLLVTDAGGNTNMCMVSVEVTDKIDAQFICPGDVTVGCNFPYDPNNLGAFFGEVEIFDNCPESNTLEDIIIGDLNTCGSGTLTRQIRLLNAQGAQVDFCLQNITFQNGTPLKFSDITPPNPEVTVTGCGIESIDPSVLGMPIVPDRECQQSAIGIENDTFPFTENGACLKIIRTFRVIDWCIDDGPGSVLQPFEFTQIIKVNNTVGPEIEIFEDSVFCSFEVDCGAINIQGYLVGTSTDDCTDDAELLNRYEVRDADSQLIRFGVGLDASGLYDVGEYTVRFISEDKCGNQSFEDAAFEVRSCKLPTPYCLHGLSTTLIAMDTTGDGTADAEMVMLPASFFDAGSYHPCGYDVQLSFSADVNDTIAAFFCSDTVGVQPIELWVTDAFGGQAFCSTFLDVQNNDDIDLCGGLRPVDIAGRIYTEQDVELKDTRVELKSEETTSTMTDEDGIYEFANMPEGGNYQVAPYKNDDPLNGVSTLDLVLIQRHILDIAPLEGAYNLIAADINNDKKVAASDILTLRKVILGVDVDFKNNTSWRFIDAGFEIVNEENPWETPLAEDYDIIGLSDDMQIDFIAVKTGDVNGSIDMNIAAGITSETRSSETLTLGLPDISVERGKLYKVAVEGTEAMNVYGMQHTLLLDGVELVNTIPGKMNVTRDHMSSNASLLNVSYASANGDQVNTGDILYTMVVKATMDGQLSDMIDISTKGLEAQSYHGNELTIGDVDITWRTANEDNLVQLLGLEGNKPNPWRNNTEIVFQLPRKGKVSLRVTDVNGRLLVSKERDFEAGENNFMITNDDVKISGILLYEIRFEDQIANSKMIRIE